MFIGRGVHDLWAKRLMYNILTVSKRRDIDNRNTWQVNCSVHVVTRKSCLEHPLKFKTYFNNFSLKIVNFRLSIDLNWCATLDKSRGSVVGIATGYGMEGGGVGVRVPVRSRIFSSPSCPDRLWGPPNLLFNGYRGFFPRGLSGRVVKLTTHLQLVLRSRKRASIYSIPHTPSWRSA
jgi:hypothetical protein